MTAKDHPRYMPDAQGALTRKLAALKLATDTRAGRTIEAHRPPKCRRVGGAS